MTLLDDLLAYEEDGSGAFRHRPLPVWKVVAGLIVLGVIAWVLHLVLGALSIGTPVLLVVAIVYAIAALSRVLAMVRAPRLPATLLEPPKPSPLRETAGDGIRAAVRLWDGRLEYAQDDARHFTHLVLPGFIDIVDERLRLRHGVVRATDPERAREIVPPALWKFITEPVPRRVTPREIATLVAQMEAM